MRSLRWAAIVATLSLAIFACKVKHQDRSGELLEAGALNQAFAEHCQKPPSAPAPVGDGQDSYRCTIVDFPQSRCQMPIKVAFFDADSTLRVSVSGSVSANSPTDVDVLPFVAAKLKKLDEDGYLIAIVSNQGGISAISPRTGKPFVNPATADAALRLAITKIRNLGGKVHYYDYAEARDRFRKPDVGMAEVLNERLTQLCQKGFDPFQSYMVGDSGYKFQNCDRMKPDDPRQASCQPCDKLPNRGASLRATCRAAKINRVLLVDGPHPDGRLADDFSNSDRFFGINVYLRFALAPVLNQLPKALQEKSRLVLHSESDWRDLRAAFVDFRRSSKARELNAWLDRILSDDKRRGGGGFGLHHFIEPTDFFNWRRFKVFNIGPKPPRVQLKSFLERIARAAQDRRFSEANRRFFSNEVKGLRQQNGL